MPSRLLTLAPFILTLGCTMDPSLGTVSEAMQCVSDGTVPGMDIASGQGTIDWPMVHAGGIAFAYMKATQSTDYTDPNFARNWSGAHSAGVLRGAYHFFNPTVDGTLQAQHFLSVMGTLADGDLPPMLDVECPDGDAMCLGYPGGSGSASGSTILTGIEAWMTAVRTATGRTPVIYTFPSYFSGAGVNATSLASDPLFIANIAGTPCFTAPAPWTTAAIWQYNWNGHVPGISGTVDLDRFMGSMADLTAFAHGVAPAWGAQYVTQSWPLTSVGHVTLRPGQHMTVSIEERNIGSHAWDSNTRLATTVPRDRASALAGPDWVAPDRPAAVTGTVATGATHTFSFTIVGPSATGTYDEHFGFVEDHTAWFSDPGELGPADDVIEMLVDVAGTPVDAGAETDAGAGGDAETDAGAETTDVQSTDVQATDVGATGDVADGGSGGPAPSGCGCEVGGRDGTGSRVWMVMGAIGVVRARRRRVGR